mgnify:CR=1 FL=1
MSYKKVKISDIGKIVSGATPKTKDVDNYGGSIAWITPADLSGYTSKYISHGSRNITQKGYDSCSTHLMPRGTVLFSSRAPIGYVAIAENPICTNQGFKSIVPNDDIDSEFLYYQLQYLRKKIQEKGSGTTFKEISGKVLGETDIVVPSLEEQFRIVAHIEELFSELDKAVDTLKTTKEQLEVYRQAVLKEIFDSVSTTSVHIKDVCLDIKVGIVIKPTQYYISENGIPAFRNANVRRGYINDTDWVMISKEGHQQNCRSEVHTNDVLISRSGANLGMASVVPARYNGYNAIDVVIAVPDISKVIPEFLAQYTNSPMGRAIVKKNERGAAQGHLNVSAYANLPIGVPDLQEQEKLVKQISDRLSVCDSIEKTVDTALAQADAMRQSILKQAFKEGSI